MNSSSFLEIYYIFEIIDLNKNNILINLSILVMCMLFNKNCNRLHDMIKYKFILLYNAFLMYLVF